MHIDFKKTAWERVFIPVGYENEIREKVKKGEITNSSDLIDLYGCTWENVLETDEQMSPSENGGCSTIEVFAEKGDSVTLWDNAEETKEISTERTLYFTVEKDVTGTGRTLDGNKAVNVYEVTQGKMANVAVIEGVIEDNSVELIKQYLNDNGFGDNAYIFVNLQS